MPKKQNVKNPVKNISSKFRSTFGDRRKLAVLLLFVIITSGVVIFSNLPKSVELDQNSEGDIQMGTVACSISLETQPLTGTPDSYSSISYDESEAISSNSPWFIGEQEVTAMDFILNIVATGNYVDWSTLSIDVTASINGVAVGTKTVPETPLEINALGYSQVVSFRISDFDLYVDPTLPDSELTDGTLLYDLDCIAIADGSINDAKGNDLEDSVTINQIWSLNSLPDGSFSIIGSEEPIKPSFESAPQATKIAQGEYLPLYWVARDDNPTTYLIRTYTTGDGSHVVEEGDWNSGDTIDYLAAGSYGSIEPGNIDLYMSCTIFDGNGQQTVHQVLIEIIVPEIELAPTFEKADGPYTNPTSGDVEVFITFKPSSPNPNSYIIYQNSDEIQRGSWDGSDLVIYIDFLYSGANDIKCVVIDTLSRSSFYVHTILTPTGEEGDPFDDFGDPTDPDLFANAPFSLGEIQGISLFMSIFFVGAGAGLWYIMKRKR